MNRSSDEDNSMTEAKYPKRVFEVIHERTHTEEECDYFFYTDPFYFD